MNFLKIGKNRFWISGNRVELFRSMDFPLSIGEIVPVGGNKYDIGGEIVKGKKEAIKRLFQIWERNRKNETANEIWE